MLGEYFRVNNPGDAVPFLPRGEVANRLGIDYVHAGPSVFLPLSSSSVAAEETGWRGDGGGGEVGDGNDAGVDVNVGGTSSSGASIGGGGAESTSGAGKGKETLREIMMRLEEDTVDGINDCIAKASIRTNIDHDGTAIASENDDDAAHMRSSLKRSTSSIRIYPMGDRPPDPLAEIDPGYEGFFPMDPRTWLFSKPFRNFLLGESVKAFRVLRGGFAENHYLTTYQANLRLASGDDVVVIDG